jgi:hypothetical protein
MHPLRAGVPLSDSAYHNLCYKTEGGEFDPTTCTSRPDRKTKLKFNETLVQSELPKHGCAVPFLSIAASGAQSNDLDGVWSRMVLDSAPDAGLKSNIWSKYMLYC